MKIKEIIKLVEIKAIDELLHYFFNVEYQRCEITKNIEIRLMANHKDIKIDEFKEFREKKFSTKICNYYSYSQRIKDNKKLTITIVKDKRMIIK